MMWRNLRDIWHCKVVLQQKCDSATLTIFSDNSNNNDNQSVHCVAPSFLNSVVGLLISWLMTEKSAVYFSDSPFWFNTTMPSFYVTVLWRRGRSKVHSSLIFVFFIIAYFFIAWELSTGVKKIICTWARRPTD